MKINGYRIDRDVLGLSVLPNLYDDMYDTYQQYKRGDYSTKINKKAEQDLDVLYILENLGYGTNQTGTYLLKDMVTYAIEKMLKSKGKVEEICQIRKEMKEPYSQFYMDIARSDRDMGLKSFHTFVNLAHANRRNIKKSMVKRTEIIPSKDEPEDQAFKVALYYIQEKELHHDIFVTPRMYQQQSLQQQKTPSREPQKVLAKV